MWWPAITLQAKRYHVFTFHKALKLYNAGLDDGSYLSYELLWGFTTMYFEKSMSGGHITDCKHENESAHSVWTNIESTRTWWNSCTKGINISVANSDLFASFS